MKRLLFCISLLIYTTIGLNAQTAADLHPTYDIPFIRAITPLSETAYYQSSLTYGFKKDSIIDEIQYYDGLGRPLQTIQRGITPERKDLVTYQEYDAVGRESNTWLPSVSSNSGAFIPLDIIQSNALTSYQDSAYSRPVYDGSPLNRIAEQYGPGKRWYNNKKSVKIESLTNKGTSGELSCIQFEVEGKGMNTTLHKDGYYKDAQLFVTKMTNEETSISYEFKDKSGQVILIRQINLDKNKNEVLLDTYYVYDNSGNLCFVIPPITSVKATAKDLSPEDLDLYGYQYKYDDFKRCTQKKLPGAKPASYIYDKADRLIFTQDGEQKKRNEWMFSLSDALGRNVLTGICKNTDITNEKYNDLFVEAEPKDDGTYRGYNILVNGQIILLEGTTLLAVSYYDNYNFLGKHTIPNWQFDPKTGYGVRFTGDNKGYETKGLLTGTSVALLDGSGEFLHSVSYYDNRGRIVQSISNNHLEGEDKTYFAYNYTDWVTNQLHEHTAKGKDKQTELYTFSYDHAGRLTKTNYKLNNLPEILLSENIYNSLGQLESTTAVNKAELKTSYGYNVRSWTNSVNNSNFNQQLTYKFNGDIDLMSWEQNKTKKSYTFEYDKISQLTKATYKGAATESLDADYEYDMHGNILFLTRNEGMKNNVPVPIDKLEFKYIGNQMKSKEDHANPVLTSFSVDAKDYVHQDIEYLYNDNGAMTQDLNKGIQDIVYNSLNLPQELLIENVDDKAKNTYLYNAAGTKLRVVHQSDSKLKGIPSGGITKVDGDQSVVSTTDYIGNLIYEDGDLKRILLSNGYYDNQDAKFYFYIKDHLGNNRIVADASGKVSQSNQFYPFGMAFAESSTDEQNDQPYKYNGKELDGMSGLNQYDYSARFYDPADIRFTTMDPHSENYYSWSPYAYVGNNPLKYADPTGMDWVYRVVDGEVEAYYDRDVTSQDQVNDKYGKDAGVAHITTGSTLTQYDNKGNIIGEFTFTNDTKANKYGTVTDMNGNTIDNSKITSGDGYSIFGTSDNSVNAATLHQGFLFGMFSGTSYIGNNNPTDYDGNYSYQYFPKGKADQAAYYHDLDYDKVKAEGLGGVFATLRTREADEALANRCRAIIQDPSSSAVDANYARKIIALFGPAAKTKSIIAKPNNIIGNAYMNSHISPAVPYYPF